MSFDSSRFTFNPWNNFFGPVMQQGRVQLDSDWNEWLAEVARRVQAGSFDTFGQSVYPSTTPNAFKLSVGTDSGGAKTIVIGPGRMYVDGLLAENHGQPAPVSQQWVPPSGPTATGLAWDSALAELIGPQGVFYGQQPYFPNASTLAPFPTTGGPYFVYLDVWKREVTLVENPDLVEKAVGVDTTGRWQTVWQVKFLDPQAQVTCATNNSDIPAWNNLLLPPGATLTTGVTQAGSPGPCCLTPNTGYTGLENQLYRLEIHQPGQPLPPSATPPITSIPSGTATFKWSRDNGSVATAVNSITGSGTVLGVESVGKDNVLGFFPNDWVEITDDWLELNGLPGELHRIAPNGVDASAKTLTLTAAVTTASFPVDANGLTNPARHTRLRRWDQGGKVYESDGVTVWTDLDAAGSTGDIPVPPPGVTLVLENGVAVTFGWDSTKAALKSGDFWNFAARATDGTVEYLDHAPPRGIHHHYCRLGVGSLQNGFQDCRVEWPPSLTGDDCECAACVTADGHNNGTFTVQAAVDKVKGAGGGKVCLGPGNYNISKTLNIAGAKSLTIAGHGAAWLLWAPAAGGTAPALVTAAILIDSSVGVTLENFGLVVPAATLSAAGAANNPAGLSPAAVLNPGVMIQNSAFVTVRECSFVCFTNTAPANPAIALGGFVAQVRINNNFIAFTTSDTRGVSSIGPGVGLSHLPTIVAAGATANPLLLTLDLYVQDNFIETASSGVDLDVLCYHAWQVQIENNFMGPFSIVGISVAGLGLPAPESSVKITDNEIVVLTTGYGIACGVGAARISGNDILCFSPITQLAATAIIGDGVLLDAPLLAAVVGPLDGLEVVGNRIAGVAGVGIEIRSQIASALIHQNLIENTGAGGIIMTESLAGVPATAQHLSIANNQLIELIPSNSNPGVVALNAALGIRLIFTSLVEVEGNVVRDLAMDATGNTSRIGIGLAACGSARIAGNQLLNIGNASATFNASAGIAVVGPPVGRVDVSGNTSRRSESLSQTGSSTAWYALFIGPLSDFFRPLKYRLVQLDANSYVYLASAFASSVVAGAQTVVVRGNFLEAATISVVADVLLSGTTGTESCIFTENQCVLIESGEAGRNAVGDFSRNVALSAPAVIAGNNVIQGGGVALALQTVPVSPARATIVGNILNGGVINLNGAALPAGSPWLALNV